MANLSGLFNLKLGASLPTKQQVKDYVNTTCKYPGVQEYSGGSKYTALFEQPTNSNQQLDHENPGVYLRESMPNVGNVERSFIMAKNKDNPPYAADYLLTNGGRTTSASFRMGDKTIYVDDKNNNGKIDAGEVTYTDKSGSMFDYFSNEKLPDSMYFNW